MVSRTDGTEKPRSLQYVQRDTTNYAVTFYYLILFAQHPDLLFAPCQLQYPVQCYYRHALEDHVPVLRSSLLEIPGY